MADNSDQIDRLDALLADQELTIQAAFRTFIAATASSSVTNAVMDFLRQRDFAGAMGIVDTYIAQMANVIPKVNLAVGEAISADLAEALPDVAAGFGFDPSLPRAAELVRTHRAEFVTDFSDEQRKATAQAIQRAYQSGAGTAETARSFRESMGLTYQEEQAVSNYRQMLSGNDPEALTRALRDQRSDAAFQRAIDRNKPLPQDRIDSMVSRYRANSLINRSERIARTEGVRATSEATIEANEQMATAAGIDASQIDYIWNPTDGNRTRAWHASMAGQKRGPDGFFIDGNGQRLRYPGDAHAPANTVINCRCVLTTSIRLAA